MGVAMKLLFVCTENKLRSATAEAVFCDWPGVEAIGAGTNADAETPVSGDLIEWADTILVMESQHRRKLTHRFASLLKDKQLIVLDVADNYSYMQPELIQLLKKKVRRILP